MFILNIPVFEVRQNLAVDKDTIKWQNFTIACNFRQKEKGGGDEERVMKMYGIIL